MGSRLAPPRNLGYVAAGGALGAVSRVALTTWFPAPSGGLPWVTLVENLLGAFLLAFVLTVLIERLALDPAVRLLVCTGLLGAFTTYSTLAVELSRLVAAGALVAAGSYLALTLAGGLTAAIVGLRLGQALSTPRRRAAPTTPAIRLRRRRHRRTEGGGR